MELTPQRVDVLLSIVHAGIFHEVVADSRVSAVCTNHEVEGHFNFGGGAWVFFGLGWVLCVVCFCARSLLEPGLVVLEVGSGKLVVEEELYVGQVVEFIQEALVQACSIYSTNKLCNGQSVK